jgi:hypothetical protein
MKATDLQTRVTICRRHAELRLPNGLTLRQCAERGRILSDDYVFDRTAQTWVPAHDLAELKSFFQTRTLRRTTRVTEVLLVVAMMSFFVVPLFAEFVLMAALASAIVAYRQRERRCDAASTVSRIALLTRSG